MDFRIIRVKYCTCSVLCKDDAVVGASAFAIDRPDEPWVCQRLSAINLISGIHGE